MSPPGGPILFVRGGALGDFVLTLPVLAACVATGRRVDVACAPRHRPLVEAVGGVHRLWDLDGVESLWMFGGRDPVGYTEAVVFAGARADLPVPRCHAVPARPAPGVAAAAHFAAVLPPTFPPVDPALRLRARPLREDAPIVLAPGASDPRRSWPLPRWRALADRLRTAAPVLLVGGPAEGWADYRPDLPELIALAASAGAWIGPDSGPTHLAARFGAPTLAIWGPTDRAWAPVGAAVLPGDVPDDAVVAWVRDAARSPPRLRGA